MGVDFKKNSHIILFAGILPVISVFLAWLFNKALPNLPYWIDSLSPLYFYGVLYYLFDKYCWKWSIFRTLGVIGVPDLNGRWAGKQLSSYREQKKNVEIKGFMEIEQSFSIISIRAYYQKSKSESVVGTFTSLNNETYLFYSFDNDPNLLKRGSMRQHKGTVKIRYIEKERLIEGFYWNSIGNQGDMRFSYIGNKLLGHFYETTPH